MKERCGVLHNRAMDHFCGDDEEKIRLFAPGFILGQAEKVYLGACRAAMFRPEKRHRKLVGDVLFYACQQYDLRQIYLKTTGEYWLFDKEYNAHMEMIALMSIRATEWPLTDDEWYDYHKERGRLCGIPPWKIDGKYHEREPRHEPQRTRLLR